MARRRRRHTKHPLVRIIAIGALILWAGLLLVGILGQEEPADRNTADLGQSTRIENPERDPQSPSQGQGPDRLRAQRNGKSPDVLSSRDSDVKPNSSQTQSTTARAMAQEISPPAPTRAVPPPAPVRSLKSADSELGRTRSSSNRSNNSPESVALTEPRRHVSNDANGPLSRSDVAPLETAPQTQAPQTLENISSSNVARAQFTTGIEAREPIDRVGLVFSADGEPIRTLYYFTELVNMSGETVTHRWVHDGVIVAEIPFHIGGDRWRVYSSKDLTPMMEGQWQVVVTDTQGDVIRTDRFMFQGP